MHTTRRNRFMIGLLSAAITFGSLMAFVGPRHHRFARHGECSGYEHHHDCCPQHHMDRDSTHNNRQESW